MLSHKSILGHISMLSHKSILGHMSILVQRLWLSSEALVEFRDVGWVQRLWLSTETLSSETLVGLRDFGSA